MPKLLLADDSITIQRVVELTFAAEDVQVDAVADGDEAIARIRAEPPDIVLADIGMPGRSGYEVAAFVKGTPELAHIPVVLLAGAFEPVDQPRAEQVRCDGVLVKPFEPQQLVARVRELLQSRQSRPPGQGVQLPSPPPREPGMGTRAPGPDAAAGPGPSGAPANEKPEPAIPESESLDDYFDRLDAAFASLGNGPGERPARPEPAADDPAAEAGVPTVDDLLGVPSQGAPGEPPVLPARVAGPPLEPPDTPAAAFPAAPAAADRRDRLPGEGQSTIADAFAALLALEQGDEGAAARLPAVPAAPAASDELVEAVARRVLERLSSNAAKDLVAGIVSEIAERLVREEIARIRQGG